LIILNFRTPACVLFFCLALSPIVTANTDTIELVCHMDGDSQSSNDRFVSIDMTSSTVVSGYTRNDRKNYSAAPAKITDDQVTWAEPVNNSIEYLLDRRNGVLTAGEHNRSRASWKCTKASRAF
jgi:exonuclease III